MYVIYFADRIGLKIHIHIFFFIFILSATDYIWITRTRLQVLAMPRRIVIVIVVAENISDIFNISVQACWVSSSWTYKNPNPLRLRRSDFGGKDNCIAESKILTYTYGIILGSELSGNYFHKTGFSSVSWGVNIFGIDVIICYTILTNFNKFSCKNYVVYYQMFRQEILVLLTLDYVHFIFIFIFSSILVSNFDLNILNFYPLSYLS